MITGHILDTHHHQQQKKHKCVDAAAMLKETFTRTRTTKNTSLLPAPPLSACCSGTKYFAAGEDDFVDGDELSQDIRIVETSSDITDNACHESVGGAKVLQPVVGRKNSGVGSCCRNNPMLSPTRDDNEVSLE